MRRFTMACLALLFLAFVAGAVYAQAITGFALALILLGLIGATDLIPLTDAVAATSVGLVEGAPLLDLTYEEDSRAEVDMNVVMTGRGQFVDLQATAEKTAFDDDQMAQLLALARKGIGELIVLQKSAEME